MQGIDVFDMKPLDASRKGGWFGSFLKKKNIGSVGGYGYSCERVDERTGFSPLW